jgi:hypothetical protein
MDAAEIARLREIAHDLMQRLRRCDAERAGAISQRDQAQKDAKDARALLGEAWSWSSYRPDAADIRARIAAMLEQKP